MRIGRVRRWCRVFGDGVTAIVRATLDLELAAVPRENLGRGAPGEGVCASRGEFDAVLLSGTGEDLKPEAAADGYLEAPFPGGLEGDDARGRGGGLLREEMSASRSRSRARESLGVYLSRYLP